MSRSEIARGNSTFFFLLHFFFFLRKRNIFYTRKNIRVYYFLYTIVRFFYAKFLKLERSKRRVLQYRWGKCRRVHRKVKKYVQNDERKFNDLDLYLPPLSRMNCRGEGYLFFSFVTNKRNPMKKTYTRGWGPWIYKIYR